MQKLTVAEKHALLQEFNEDRAAKLADYAQSKTQ